MDNDDNTPTPLCPHCHEQIIGTCEHTPGCALATFTLNADGSVDYDHDGETKMYWDGQTTDEEDGEVLVQCDGGHECKLSEIYWLQPDEEDQRITADDLYQRTRYGTADYSKPMPVELIA